MKQWQEKKFAGPPLFACAFNTLYFETIKKLSKEFCL